MEPFTILFFGLIALMLVISFFMPENKDKQQREKEKQQIEQDKEIENSHSAAIALNFKRDNQDCIAVLRIDATVCGQALISYLDIDNKRHTAVY